MDLKTLSGVNIRRMVSWTSVPRGRDLRTVRPFYMSMTLSRGYTYPSGPGCSQYWLFAPYKNSPVPLDGVQESGG